jgi:hypothetical protein
MLDDDIKILLREVKLEKYIDELERFSARPQERISKADKDPDLVLIKVKKEKKSSDFKKPLFFLSLLLALGIFYNNYLGKEPPHSQAVAVAAIVPDGPEQEVKSLLKERKEALDKIREQISSLILQHGDCKMKDFTSTITPLLLQIDSIDKEYTTKVALVLEDARKKQEGERSGEEQVLSSLAEASGFSS